TFSTQALDFIPPVIDVTDPVTTVWTAATSYRITGSVSKVGSKVEVFRNGTAVEQHQLGPDEKDFAIDVPLLTDGTNSFVLRATDPLGNISRQDTFLPGIVQDSTAPRVTVLAPTEDARLAGGSSVLIRWDAVDANFDSGPIGIFFSHEGGQWEQLSAHETNDGEFSWEVPHNAAGQGQIRIVAEDRVGFTAEAVSALFFVDSDAPAFAAVTSGTHRVAVQFTEPVTGNVAADEWTICTGPENEQCLPAASASEEELTSSADSPDLSGISRLVLETVPAQEIGRNELPQIEYNPGTVPGRQEFRDEAGNAIPDGAKSVKAEDGILPLIPTIKTIAGQAAGGESGDATPDVVIGNIEEGDTALVFAESDGEAGFSGGDRQVGSAEAGAEGATVTTDHLGLDGDYTLYATARDVHGNVSDGADDALYKLRSGILPQVPVIEEIAGQPADADVTAKDPSPDVKVGDIAETFVAEVYVDSDGTVGFSSGDRKVGEATADKDGALVHTSDLGTDGTYTLLAVTRNVVGNRSPGGDEATYILDMTSPAFTAKVLDSRHVAVDFSEPVSGVIAELEWRIDGLPANTTREPDVAEDMTSFGLGTLHLQEIQVGQSPEITYNPGGAEAASPAPAELRDAAGNFIRTKIARAVALAPPGQPTPPGGNTGGTGTPPAQPSEEPGGVPGEPTADLVCTIVGTGGNDILLGTEGPDVMCPQGGEDRIVA
ncbi:MAG: hypothetical protein M3138_07185, partial [Actinomycetota bacterium]|nr:hypothetical protein [Actinomycetota bacterium]